MMTFSLSPSSGSYLPLIAASVRTRVVSWKLAAERNDSVASEAFVTPSSTGFAVDGSLPAAFIFSLASLNAPPRSTARQQRRVAAFDDLHLAQHRANDNLDVLVVDVDALRAVDLLHFLNEIVLQRSLALDAQNVVRVERAFVELLARLDVLRPPAPRDACPAGSRTRALRRSSRRRKRCACCCSSPNLIVPACSEIVAWPLGLRASKISSTRGRPVMMSSVATPPVWNVRSVSCVPGSPIDCAAMMPTAVPMSARLPGREIAAVAERADAVLRLGTSAPSGSSPRRCPRRERLGLLLVDLFVARDDRRRRALRDRAGCLRPRAGR